MNRTTEDTCHCLVRHPEKAKFLVVKHEDSWSPPVLKFPSGLVDFKVRNINRGMRDKYGLKTHVLRPLTHLPNYHCIEMELVSTQPDRKMQAVWVGQEEYLRTRNTSSSGPDPFAQWFEEQASGKVHELRPPFHRPGWFDQAEHWIHFQLDRLAIQVTGSVEQFRQGSVSSCLLRVPTNQGWVYFKAGNESVPGEAALTEQLAERWPKWVARPLAIDARRNWMLSRDLEILNKDFDLQTLPDFAREMAHLQLESRNFLNEWKSLGCREYTLKDFSGIAQNPEPYQPVLQEGGGGLDDQEWQALKQAMAGIVEDCRILADTGLPAMLVHTDFRDSNLARQDGNYLFLDWSDTIISHPFLVLGWIFQDHTSVLEGRSSSGMMRIDEALYQRVLEAYLEPFSMYEGLADSQSAVRAANNLNGLWSMLLQFQKLQRVEPRTIHWVRQVVGLQQYARQFINRAKSST